MVFSVLNELLTSCQLSMQMREPAIGRRLCLELGRATFRCCEIHHSRFNSCLYPCGSCHVWVSFHCKTFHIREALWERGRYSERSLPQSFITLHAASFSISEFLGTLPSLEQRSAWLIRYTGEGSPARLLDPTPWNWSEFF